MSRELRVVVERMVGVAAGAVLGIGIGLTGCQGNKQGGDAPEAAVEPAAEADPVEPAGEVDGSEAEGSEGQADAEPTPTWEPTEAQAGMVQALSARDGSPPCADVVGTSEDPVGDLAAIVQHVSAPPWVGMRAAGCLARDHALAAEPLMLGWVTSSETKGLGYLVLGELDQMPEEIALGLAKAALEKGPDPEGAKRRIGKSEVEAVRGLVE